MCIISERNAPIPYPHGGLRRFRWGRKLGCYATKFGPRKALKLIAVYKPTFHERFVLYRTEGQEYISYLIRMKFEAVQRNSRSPDFSAVRVESTAHKILKLAGRWVENQAQSGAHLDAHELSERQYI